MKKAKKCILTSCVILLLTMTLIIPYVISYHEKNNYLDILSISYAGDKNIKYEDEIEIKHMENKIRRINFYPSDCTQLEESPDKFITIKYKNGTKKVILIDFVNVVIITESQDGITEGSPKFFYVNPLVIKYIFNE